MYGRFDMRIWKMDGMCGRCYMGKSGFCFFTSEYFWIYLLFAQHWIWSTSILIKVFLHNQLHNGCILSAMSPVIHLLSGSWCDGCRCGRMRRKVRGCSLVSVLTIMCGVGVCIGVYILLCGYGRVCHVVVWNQFRESLPVECKCFMSHLMFMSVMLDVEPVPGVAARWM
jgi:hypothetical protein